MKEKFLIGTSGFYYAHWYERFYPKDLPREELLSYYAQFFNTVELNSTFYHLPKQTTVKNWAKKVPKDFIFTVKASRFITHRKKLQDITDALHLFYNRIEPLDKKLGPILFQLPPSLGRDEKRLVNFLKNLSIMKNQTKVIEFRNESWLCDSIFEILKEHNITYCIVSMPDFPKVIEITGPVVYVRFHGASSRYSSSYSEEELKGWIEEIKSKIKNQNIKVKQIYAYFNNDYNAYAIENAQILKKWVEPRSCTQGLSYGHFLPNAKKGLKG